MPKAIELSKYDYGNDYQRVLDHICPLGDAGLAGITNLCVTCTDAGKARAGCVKL